MNDLLDWARGNALVAGIITAAVGLAAWLFRIVLKRDKEIVAAQTNLEATKLKLEHANRITAGAIVEAHAREDRLAEKAEHVAHDAIDLGLTEDLKHPPKTEDEWSKASEIALENAKKERDR